MYDSESTIYEVNLRATEENPARQTAPRPHSTSKVHNFFNSAFRNTFLRKKRRVTTPVYENELLKNNISAPASCSKMLYSENEFRFSKNSIQRCPFDISGYGSFLLMDEFKVRKPKKLTLTVFLFEKIMIFTKKQPNDETYYYVGSLKMDELGLMPQGQNQRSVVVKDHAASSRFHKDIIFSLEASSEYIETQWRRAIEKCLWGQLIKAKREAELAKS